MSSHDTLAPVIRGRRSIRRFQDRPLERETVEQLVELASWAPSAGNRQDWIFTLITSKAIEREMAATVRQRWSEIIAANRDLGIIEEVKGYAARFADFAEAPAVIVVSAKRVDSVQTHMLGDDASATIGSFISAAMAAQMLMLAAHAEGLGTCCMTGALAARDEIQRIVGLNKRHEIVCLIALGWPDEIPAAPARKPVSEILRHLP